MLSQNIRKQDDNHAQLLAHSKTIGGDIGMLGTSSTREHEAIVSGITRNTLLVHRKLKRIDGQNSKLSRKMQNSISTLSDFRSQTERMETRSQRSLDSFATGLKELHAQTTFIASSFGMTTEIVREELRTTLKPIIEQAFTTADARNEARMQRVNDLIQQITQDLGRSVTAQSPENPISSFRNHGTNSEAGQCNSLAESDLDHQQKAENLLSPLENLDSASIDYETITTYKSRWKWAWKIGTFIVNITHQSRRINGSSHAISSSTVELHF
jgi:hypothetical protein